jgi:DnaK suppressor protein
MRRELFCILIGQVPDRSRPATRAATSQRNGGRIRHACDRKQHLTEFGRYNPTHRRIESEEVATKTMKPAPNADSTGSVLTEEQLLKMGDKDYMNEEQLAFFKARLQQLEKDLLRNAGETTEHLRETVLVPDPADRATIEEEHALELRTRDRERKLLKKVQQSIASIDAGEYGWCEETGEPIGIPRLLARPTATLSLEAQQRRELKQKLYGD